MSEENGGNGNGRLTGLQRAFVDEWFANGFNGVKAAETAGYQGDYWTLAAMASENLKKPKIQAEIEKRWALHNATSSEVVSRLARWMRFDISQLFDSEGNISRAKIEEFGDCIKKLEITEFDDIKKYRVEAHDQMRAAELVGKTMRLFVDGLDVTTKGESLNDGKITAEQHARTVASLFDALAEKGGRGDSSGQEPVGAAE